MGYAENLKEEKWETANIINKKPAEILLEKYASKQSVDQAFAALKNYWTELLSRFQITTKNEKVNRMVNIWNQYQCMVTFNMSRSASYYESGIGRGMASVTPVKTFLALCI